MRIVRFARCLAALATGGLAVALLGAQNSAAIPKVVQDASVKVQSSIGRFAQTHSFTDLQAAIDSLYGTIQPRALTPANFVETRRTLARSWASILKDIEASYDPTYDPNDRRNVPFLCVPPPDIEGAASCMAPDKISDPNVRAQYVKEINENNLKRKRLEHYLGVKRLDDEAMSALDMSLKLFNDIAPANIGPDAAALDSIFRSAGISAHRLNKIHQMIYARNPSQKT
jgi:hypothetical protein